MTYTPHCDPKSAPTGHLDVSKEMMCFALLHADAYVDGPGIIMELIQNADDAGATEVALMMDQETYGSESIIGLCPNLTHLRLPY